MNKKSFIIGFLCGFLCFLFVEAVVFILAERHRDEIVASEIRLYLNEVCKNCKTNDSVKDYMSVYSFKPTYGSVDKICVDGDKISIRVNMNEESYNASIYVESFTYLNRGDAPIIDGNNYIDNNETE